MVLEVDPSTECLVQWNKREKGRQSILRGLGQNTEGLCDVGSPVSIKPGENANTDYVSAQCIQHRSSKESDRMQAASTRRWNP
jgi:hypothetical protein